MAVILILDTSAIVEILRGSQKGKEIVGNFLNEDAAISAFSAYELLWSRPEKEREILEFVKRFNVLNFELEQSIKAAEIKRILKNKGITINEVDIFIASIAIMAGFLLVSCDKDFKKIPGLKARIF